MSVWEDQVLPRLIDRLLASREVGRHRRRATEGLSGTVVEVGFGSGLNVPYYPDAVTELLAVEPSGVARRLSEKRVEQSKVVVRQIGLDGQHIPLGDGSVDAALSTFTLCTIPDAGAALAEIRRVLRPGGRLHFLEHGLAPDPKTARRQRRWNGFQQRVGGGCNLNRAIDRLVLDAGFEVDELRNEWMRGPSALKPWNYLYTGVAISPSAR